MLVTGRPCMKTESAAAIVLFLLVLWTGAPEDGVSPTREAEPTPGGDDCTENACGLNPNPVLSIALFEQSPDRSSKATADNL